MSKVLAHSLAIQRQLVLYLADGEICSGEWLGQQLGISRAAIAKHLVQLEGYGLDLYKIKGKGYRLAEPLQLLDAALIKQQQQWNAPVWVQSVTDSTNNQLLQKLSDGQSLDAGTVLVAEAQTAGRGRRGKNWISPFGANLYFSMYWPLEQGIQAAMGLSLVIGVAVAKTLEQLFQLPVQLKWPNDIYLDGKKLGGILVELAGQSHSQCDAVIGLGLNISMPSVSAAQIDQPFTSLHSVLEQRPDRNQLVVALQKQLVSQLLFFADTGFAPFAAEFSRRDLFAGQWVQLSSAKQQVQGLCCGVDERGALLLESDGQRQSHYGGELSLRRIEHAPAD
ncbi:bifunctional biotin--[acetyl-CoA-carboxylase] ligase/biotin operon repressor BirA [Rheinheimera sp.]|uniref:bifunctional biotin--[acetyl-CoA-carboxylase] ligase/biotin operon repressor BirA n=1 Tax=Rheinheimera sp. TaxID=1869214 RepID=UPI00307DEE78